MIRRLMTQASVLVFLLAACRPHPLEEAKRLVPIGMFREEAIQILDSEAWYHQECPSPVRITDLFFYGSHQYDEADIVILESLPEGEIYRVAHIGTFEPNAWHTAYRDCVRRDKFED